MVLMKLFTGQQWRYRHREQTHGHGSGAGGRRRCGESNMDTYITKRKIGSQWEFAVWLTELNFHTLATSCEELTHWKRPWCWDGLGAGGEGDDRGWDGWMASPTQWAWVWVNSWSWWWTGRPGVLRFTGSQRVGHDWATELNWTKWDQMTWSLFFEYWVLYHHIFEDVSEPLPNKLDRGSKKKWGSKERISKYNVEHSKLSIILFNWI